MFNSFPSAIKDGGSNIKSLQKGSVSATSSSTTTNVTINNVNIDKSIVISNFNINYDGTSATANANNILFTSKLSSSNLLVLERGNSVINTIGLNYQVIEFNNVKSKQSGTTTLLSASTSITVTISPINIEKHMLVYSVRATNVATFFVLLHVGGRVNNATQLEFIHSNGSATETMIIEWQLIEFI